MLDPHAISSQSEGMRILALLLVLSPLAAAGGLDKACTKRHLEVLIAAGEKNGKAGAEALDGDALFDSFAGTLLLQVRAGAEDATATDRELRAAFVALGLFLDDGQLSSHKSGRIFAEIETPELDAAGRAARGRPTISGREDLARHFALSAALAAGLGEGIARLAGMAKEMEDMHGLDKGKGSGFSFVDLAANEAGIRFAVWLLQDPAPRLAGLNGRFRQADCVPGFAGLPEGLRTDEFDDRFGPVGSRNYNRVWKPVEEAIAALPVYREEGR
ncbi:MAG: hypothetical protein HUU15_09975 [Candidatus Brocadiae bacterium]|nr:hypothetical protein [Candidatus Brocadiia bacterium]